MDALDKALEILEEENPKEASYFHKLGKDDRFRALVNIRMPRKPSKEYLEAESAYLKEYLNNLGTVSLSSLDFFDGMAIYRGNIILIKADAIANAGNSQLLGCFQPLHKCIDNWIHTYAGVKMRYDLNEMLNGREAETAEVVITEGYNLPCRYVFHIVGPIVYGRPGYEEESLLIETYLNCLNKAKEMHLDNIAFPCISTGVFGYPKEEAAKVAYSTVSKWLKENRYPLKVVFCVYEDIDETLYKELLKNHG